MKSVTRWPLIVSTILFCFFNVLCATSVLVAEDSVDAKGQIQSLLDGLSGKSPQFAIDLNLELPIDGKPQTIEARFVRYDGESFDLIAKHPEYSVQIHRRADTTVIALPHHKRVFLGSGTVNGQDTLQPDGSLDRLISSGTAVAFFKPWLNQDADALIGMITLGLQATVKEDKRGLQFGDHGELTLGDHALEGTYDQISAKLRWNSTAGDMPSVTEWVGYETTTMPREEIERQLARGARRALEILAPSPRLTQPGCSTGKLPTGNCYGKTVSVWSASGVRPHRSVLPMANC